jgi:Spy/CpxP family protein refolding chaperone
MKKILSAALFAALAIAALPALAQGQAAPAPANDMQALRNAVKADKRALVAKTLELTPAEEKKFWPIYDNYQRALDASNRQVALAVEELVARGDRPMSDAYGKQLAAELIEADEHEIKARRKMQGQLMRALPPKKAARYLQLESKIRAFQDYDLAVVIPLVK